MSTATATLPESTTQPESEPVADVRTDETAPAPENQRASAAATQPAAAPADDGGPSKALRKDAERIAARLLKAECSALVYRVEAGRIAREAIVRERPRKREYVLIQIAELVEAESGLQVKPQELVQLAATVDLMAGVGGIEADDLCKRLPFRVVRELCPLVDRRADAEEWYVKAGIDAECKALVELLLGPARMSGEFTAAQVKLLQAKHYQHTAAGIRATAAKVSSAPERERLEKQATQAEQRATKLTTPKGKPATAAATDGASQAPQQAEKPVPASQGDDMAASVEAWWERQCFGPDEWEPADEFDDKQCADPGLRAEYAVQALTYGRAVQGEFVGKLFRRYTVEQRAAFVKAMLEHDGWAEAFGEALKGMGITVA